ncbi:hypothetical protein ACHAXR_011775 [Thalassiosira sp. AJA248-18]
MVGVKGNSGKATRMNMSTQLLAVFVFAAAVVASVKVFGSAPWHAKAIMEDQQHHPQQTKAITNVKSANVADITVAKEADKDIQDKNLVQFVFSNLDGEEGHEGEVVVRLHPEWAPIGVTRIKDLTADSFWDGCRAFRVLPNFVVQLGINGDPDKQKKWRKNIADDPVHPSASNVRGTVTFAMAGKGTRTTQIFFNKVNNSRLDKENFAPFGEVISGMDIIDRIYAGYKEEADQGFIQQKGNAYLEKNFPKMSFIKSAKFISSTEVS